MYTKKTKEKMAGILKKYGVKNSKELEERLEKTRRYYTKYYRLEVPRIAESSRYDWDNLKIKKINPNFTSALYCHDEGISSFVFNRGTPLEDIIKAVRKANLNLDKTAIFITIK
ncbi:MAG: hypothetical protein UT05_C0001G0034 [Parcubacteria group bacterium GW2011_GWF2_38_76]|nr:MAG: hypothetical protein UT05_C0001G0034 [Parcubacteria group bacterium GW2011_GWF2_38_76]HBM45989.1 hypothetical protein [Patescibacteria group bacterium]